jgi:hypothetical protein
MFYLINIVIAFSKFGLLTNLIFGVPTPAIGPSSKKNANSDTSSSLNMSIGSTFAAIQMYDYGIHNNAVESVNVVRSRAKLSRLGICKRMSV